jgi:hypothetical protein
MQGPGKGTGLQAKTPFAASLRLPRQFQADISSATATLRQPQLSGPPSFAKTQIAHYKTTVPILRTVTKPNVKVAATWHRY